jgi:hypothetical protein
MLADVDGDVFVPGPKRATVAGLALVSAALMFAVLVPVPAPAQGPPASVTSTGFGGHFGQAPGVPASVTSHGWNNPSSNRQFFTQPACCINPLFPSKPTPSNSQPFRHRHQHFTGAVPVYVPYSPLVMAPPEDEQPPSDEDDRGGPTIFDRRGQGTPRRPTESLYARRDDSSADVQADAKPAEDQPQTLLVFKDGHEDQVRNYAVVGNMLYDLTPGRHRKIALADLDLKATAQQNDDMGISFQVPANLN